MCKKVECFCEYFIFLFSFLFFILVIIFRKHLLLCEFFHFFSIPITGKQHLMHKRGNLPEQIVPKHLLQSMLLPIFNSSFILSIKLQSQTINGIRVHFNIIPQQKENIKPILNNTFQILLHRHILIHITCLLYLFLILFRIKHRVLNASQMIETLHPILNTINIFKSLKTLSQMLL